MRKTRLSLRDISVWYSKEEYPELTDKDEIDITCINALKRIFRSVMIEKADIKAIE